jgi:transcriptional regulator PpsR
MPVSEASIRPTEAPDLGALAALAPQLAQTFVSLSSDIALVLDAEGVIRTVCVGAEPLGMAPGEWVGRTWADVVTGDTRPKVEQLLLEVRTGQSTRRREVNHPSAGGQDIPISYAAVRLGQHGPVLVVGRDLRAIAAIQQRFIDAQQEMERDYWKQRQAESRYRLLFQVATDAVMVVDARSLRIVEANQAAGQLFGRSSDELIGQNATIGVARGARPGVEELLVMARSTGRPAEVRAMTDVRRGSASPSSAIDVSATPFRAGESMLLLVRARVAVVRDPVDAQQRLIDLVERTPDAVVITDSSSRVLMANPAFMLLCLRDRDVHVQGRTLAELLGDPQRDLVAAVTETRRMGIFAQREIHVGHSGAPLLGLEVSAALLAEGDQECLGLTLRRVATRAPAHLPPQVGALAEAIDRLSSQMGLASLPDLLQGITDLAERHLIEAALSKRNGDRQRAAEMLDITPTVLATRMRHLGIAEDDTLRAGPPTLLN